MDCKTASLWVDSCKFYPAKGHDGTNWTAVAADYTITEADTFITVPCDRANAGYVRLWETSLNLIYRQCTEFEVYASTHFS
ncbi:MAG: hypothetical protein KAU52_08305 [Methanosarcinales archaeon]|nr:hypothetical protein [Methanosarcinales archaeon]